MDLRKVRTKLESQTKRSYLPIKKQEQQQKKPHCQLIAAEIGLMEDPACWTASIERWATADIWRELAPRPSAPSSDWCLPASRSASQRASFSPFSKMSRAYISCRYRCCCHEWWRPAREPSLQIWSLVEFIWDTFCDNITRPAVINSAWMESVTTCDFEFKKCHWSLCSLKD